MRQIQLYDYQLDMLQRIEAAFKSHQSVMVQMPTGTGKTLVLASVVKSEERRVKNPCVWIVAHRRELVEQIEATLDATLEASLNVKCEVLSVKLEVRVFSIQWLARHYRELDDEPSLIVIDEAHHALAKTYAEIMKAFPEAKKLGVTATPCRLTRKGFTDLFDVLLTSKPISTFIKEGYLSDFDYVSLNPNSEDQKKINGLAKRATDGDYSVAEMQEVLDTRPSIERLFNTIKEFVKGKKGIVYAINIEHAEHIAEYYREHGMNAVAINSKTPKEERKSIIERFKNSVLRKPKTSATIEILVNVDLFNEGFDCPDVEFIQLARPTLSLAKYLQMVGRGLRVAKNKVCCIILDNVGLYRLFGLPNAERDWEAMFLGRQTGKGVADMARDWALRVYNYSENQQFKQNQICNRDMIVITRHDTPSVAERISILLDEFGKAQNFKYEKHGLLGEHTYIRTSNNTGVYHIFGEERLGWRIMYDLQTIPHKYYLLNMEDGRMVYVGRVNIWDKPTGGVENNDTYVCKHIENNEYAIYNQRNEIILSGLTNVMVSDGNIAEVIFKGADKTTWINLYTLQEFYERPIVVRRANQEFMRVGDDLYSYNNRQIAGIPLKEKEILLYASPMDNVEQLRRNGVVMYKSRKKIDVERPWADLINGIRFAKQPRIETHGFLEFSTTDGMRLYPRVRTKLMDEKSFVMPDALTHGIEDGLRFRNFYIPPSDNPKLYVFKEKMDNTTLFKGENNEYYIRCGLESTLRPTTLEEWKTEKRKWKRMVDDFEKRADKRQRTGVFKYPLHAEINHGYKLENYCEPTTDIRITRNGKVYNTARFDIPFGKWRPTGSYTEIGKQAYGIRIVRNWEGKYLLRTLFFEKFGKGEDPKFDFAELLDDAYLHIKEDGKEYYVDLESRMCFNEIPKIVKIGFVRFQKDGDMYFPFNYRLDSRKPFRRGEIIGGEDICFIGKNMVILKNTSSIFYIHRRYSDGKRFIVSKKKTGNITETMYDLYYDGRNPAELKQSTHKNI